jgi:hypothetical protein
MSTELPYPGLEMDRGSSTVTVTALTDQVSPLPLNRFYSNHSRPHDNLPQPAMRRTSLQQQNPQPNMASAHLKKDVEYGYGDAAPDVATNNTNDVFYDANQNSNGAIGTVPASAEDLYGYGSGSPDVGKKEKTNAAAAANLYGYGSGSPGRSGDNGISIVPLASETDHYRYATGEPFSYDGTRVPRRSSLKSSSSYHGGSGSRSLRRDRAHSDDGIQAEGDPPGRRRPQPRRNSAIQVRMRGESQPVQRRRSIDFAPKVHVKEVEPVSQLTENVRDLWLQADDFDAMKQHRRQLLMQYKLRQQQCSVESVDGRGMPSLMAPTLTSILHKHEKNDEHSFRGLERYIDKSGRRTKNAAWDTVLLEQDEQECSGYFDERRIAELYKYSTQESPEKAFARAQQDREAVEEYLTSPRTKKLMDKTKFKALRRVSC